MPVFYTSTASFDYLEITSSLVVDSAVATTLGSNTSTFTGSFSGSFTGNGASLTNIVPVIFKTTTDSPSVTGTTAITQLTQSLIPANSFAAGDLVEIRTRVRKTGTAVTASFRWYTNTANNLSGATLIATHISSAPNAISIQNIRELVIKATNSTQVINSSTSYGVDDAAVATTATTIATDWTADQYIIFTAALGNIADSCLYSYYRIVKY